VQRRSVPIILLVAAIASAAAVWGIYRIEQAGPPIKRVIVTPAFSPNGDGSQEAAGISFILNKPGHVRVRIVRGSDTIATLLDRRESGRVTTRWNGAVSKSRFADDGAYTVVVELKDRDIELPTPIRVDTVDPTHDGRATLDLRRIPSMHVVRFDVSGLHGAVERWLELDSERLPTVRTIRSANRRKSGRFDTFIISARLPESIDATRARSVLLGATDAAGNRIVVEPTSIEVAE
jgi:hypothetical protein